MKIGITGLPNVGKSTLFNAFLGRQQALSANYPFATIEPNVGVVDVPDKRVDVLGKMSKSEKNVYANITFVDIAGIVEGANQGEGLGNQFLANIREVDLILVLLRAFQDDTVVREGSKDPQSDYEVILTELILKDIETLQKLEGRLRKTGDTKEEKAFKSGVEKVLPYLEEGFAVSKVHLDEEESKQVGHLQLLTSKPMLKLWNVDETGMASIPDSNSSGHLIVSANIESELSVLSKADRRLYLKELDLTESPLNKVIRECYKILGLQTFLTTGPKESRAWKFKQGMNASECAGVIHTDFEKNFIKAEVVFYEDFVECNGKLGAKDKGKLRLEGKDYSMKDGDVVEFRVGA